MPYKAKVVPVKKVSAVVVKTDNEVIAAGVILHKPTTAPTKSRFDRDNQVLNVVALA